MTASITIIDEDNCVLRIEDEVLAGELTNQLE